MSKNFSLSFSRASSAAAILWCLATGLAYADAVQDAGRLIKQGQQAQALEQLDKFLTGKPKDPQARFLRGIALTEMNRTTEAIAVFQRLTEDYPELPEPYNNLAVIFAQQKQYEKAKGALEMAIRTHPSYATAHENLGDIYARLASQAYDKALQLDSSNASAQSKLALIRDLMTTSVRPPVHVAAKTQENPKPTAVPATQPPPTVATPPVKVPEPAKPVVAEKSPPANQSADVAKALDAWASAWSNKDVKAYLSHYAPSFKTPGGISRSAWEAERRQRINKPGAIEVDIEKLNVKLDGDTATATFRQNYRSASLKVSSTKTITLVRRDARWLITSEQAGSR
jgi:Flp pilus assembly protein TadD/ketosteroid isomerase-like protein